MEITLRETQNKIKELHGVGNGPSTACFTQNKINEFKQAGIPYSRLHDTEGWFGSGEFVNIHCVFPNFEADVDDPASYNFACTDLYLQKILESGAEPYYRLGETIENSSSQVKRYINPPKDMFKWAQICEHIIRHYNEGWADGFRMDIEYWEIWNEPDNEHMWAGEKEEFYKLYSITANHLKKCFPDIKVGGYAATGFYCALKQDYTGISSMDNWFSKLIPFAEGFLNYITAPETKAPLDFFSWHYYSTEPEELTEISEYVRNLLDSYGFTETESHLNEWNYNDLKSGGNTTGVFRKTMTCAAFVSACLINMQKTYIDKAMYYDAEVRRDSYCGLFSLGKKAPEKPYYALLSFNEIFKLGNEMECVENTEGLYTLAASDCENTAVLITNYENDDKCCIIKTDNIKNKTKTEIFILDENKDLELVEVLDNPKDINIESKKNSVILVKIR